MLISCPSVSAPHLADEETEARRSRHPAKGWGLVSGQNVLPVTGNGRQVSKASVVPESCAHTGGGYPPGPSSSAAGEASSRALRGHRGWKVFLWGLVYLISGTAVNSTPWLACRPWGGCSSGPAGPKPRPSQSAKLRRVGRRGAGTWDLGQCPTFVEERELWTWEGAAAGDPASRAGHTGDG